MQRKIDLAFNFAQSVDSELLARHNEACIVAGESFLRGQAAAVRDAVSCASDVLVVHRSWDDFTIRLFFGKEAIPEMKILLDLPEAFVHEMKHNSIAVTVCNQRRFVRYRRFGHERVESNAAPVVLPAKVVVSNSAEHLCGALDEAFPDLDVEAVRLAAERAPAVCSN